MANWTIGGLDEAGRGPLAGPVTAGACVLNEGFDLGLLNDSKVMTPRQRERAFERLTQETCWGIGWCSAEEIDERNIHHASLEAMRRAWFDLLKRFPECHVDEIIVDGLFVPKLAEPVRSLVKADSLVPTVSAASILAKVSRDRYMVEADRQDSRYGFARHKGYPTVAHRQAIALYGPGPLHRRSFRMPPNPLL